jgi:hypothetical protein
MSHRTPFLSAYLKAITFTDCSEGDFVHCDFSPQLELQARADCLRFELENSEALRHAYITEGYGPQQAGHDFWLTRNGHGAGFWDRHGLDGPVGEALRASAKAFGEVSLYAEGELVYCY